MRLRVIATFAIVLGCLQCGGAMGDARSDGTSGGTGNSLVTAGGESSGSLGAAGSGASGGITSTYVDPDCPNEATPTVYAECDPLGDGSDCPSGEGCYPTTEYPDEACESETYRMLCLWAGTGQQWDYCDALNDCASGFVCVVTGEGTECMQMCDPTASSTCPTGLFCDAVDLQGIGICS